MMQKGLRKWDKIMTHQIPPYVAFCTPGKNETKNKKDNHHATNNSFFRNDTNPKFSELLHGVWMVVSHRKQANNEKIKSIRKMLVKIINLSLRLLMWLIMHPCREEHSFITI